jgi:hypothetical protein
MSACGVWGMNTTNKPDFHLNLETAEQKKVISLKLNWLINENERGEFNLGTVKISIKCESDKDKSCEESIGNRTSETMPNLFMNRRGKGFNGFLFFYY